MIDLSFLALSSRRSGREGRAFLELFRTTAKRLRACEPNVVIIGMSAASRPRAIRIRPICGYCVSGRNVNQRPPRASNQALKSIGAGSGGTPMSPR